MTSADAEHRKSGALASGWRDFRRWRRGRPFWAGLFTLLSGLVSYFSTQLSFSNFQIKIGNEGFLSYIIPLVLLLCALLIWFTPQQRVFYGVIAAAVALYSFIGVNFGGFLLGMLFGIIGGSLAIAWTPVTPAPPPITPAPPAEEAGQPGGGPAETAAAPGEPDERAPETTVDDLFTGPLTDVLPPPVNPLAQPPPDPGNGRPLPRRTPRLFAVTLVPLLLTAVAIVGVPGGTPARAEPASPYPSRCPTGTKSASAVKPKPSSGSASKSPASEPAEVTKRPGTTAGPAAGPSASASPSPSSTDDGGGLIGGVIDGIGNLLGIGDGATPSPSVTPPTKPAAPSGTGQTPTPSATPSSVKPSSAKPAKSASVAPKPTSSAGCLAVEAKELAADGVPLVQKVPDQMRGSKLTLKSFAFDGVTELNTAGGGTIRVLQFSMSNAVTDDFELRVPGPAEHTTSLKSSALTVRRASGDGGRRVKFYCSEFTGTLAEVIGITIPVPIPRKLTTFTPDSPPPLPPSLTVPEIAFTGIDIQLVFVDSDVLSAPDLNTTIEA